MSTDFICRTNTVNEAELAHKFLRSPDEASFAALFHVYSPQLIAFFRRRLRGAPDAEDLAQEVMWTVYRKAKQIRHHQLFRPWLFKVAHNTLMGHYSGAARQLPAVSMAGMEDEVVSNANTGLGTPGFDLHTWMQVLDVRERELMVLRFVEQWQYHEIAEAHSTPIGTVQWRIFHSKRKLAAHFAITKKGKHK